MTTHKQAVELVIETSFGILRIPGTARIHQVGEPPAASFRAQVDRVVEDVRNFVAPEYAEVPRGPSEHGEHPDDGFATDKQIAETIRRNRRAIMPDPTERDKPKSKAELARKLANTGKLCPGCNERCGPRTKICMCGHDFYRNGAAA